MQRESYIYLEWNENRRQHKDTINSKDKIEFQSRKIKTYEKVN